MTRTPFAGKTVLITGASSGIGAALARQFAEQGARLALLARRTQRLEALAAELAPLLAQRAAPPAFVQTTDVADPAQCDDAVARIEGAMGSVDVLVNNAGLGDLGPFWQAEPAAIQRMIDVNISAVTRLTRRLTPAMVQRRQGWIMNVASAGGFHPMPLMAEYGASKAYVISFSEALHEELRPHGVRVCCVCPGTTRTEFFDRGGFEKRRDWIYKFGAKDPEHVARLAIRSLARGKMTVVHGLATRVETQVVVRLLPRRLAAWIVGLALRKTRGKPQTLDPTTPSHMNW